jgi:hypothetical protein
VQKEQRDAAVLRLSEDVRHELALRESAHAAASLELEMARLDWDTMRYLVRIYEADSRMWGDE